jgi:hypothetical protein
VSGGLLDRFSCHETIARYRTRPEVCIGAPFGESVRLDSRNLASRSLPNRAMYTRQDEQGAEMQTSGKVDIALTIKNPATGKDIVALANQSLLPKDQKPTMELFKEIYKESLNGYRFYGTLRASIAWPPATILGAGFVYFSQNSDIHDLPFGRYILPIFFAIVLALIIFVNYRLQLMQAESVAVARQSLKHWKEGLTGSNIEPFTYSELRGRVSFSRRFDGPTWSFIIFCVVLITLNFIISFFPATPPT